MGVLTASKPWPMSPPLNPADFPGSNPHAVQATVISNYLRDNPAPSHHQYSPSNYHHQQQQQHHHHHQESQEILPEFMRRMTLSSQEHHRASMMIKSPAHHQPPLYETVRPKSTSFDDDFKLKSFGLSPASGSIRVENDYQIHPIHYRQRSDGSSPAVRRPPVPPPLPPVNPRPIFRDDSCLSRAEAHLLQPPPTPTCVPWLKKVKVIKNIKRKIGIGGKAGTSFNNLPPLNFHSVHGENVQIFQEGAVARRINSFCKAIVFSNRPVKVNEKVSVRLIELSNNWSGVLRFGFTNVDPSSLRNNLPKYVCPDLTSRPGFWAKAFSDQLVKKDATLNFHVNSGGEIHFGIDGEDKGIFLSGIDTRSPLWAVMDIYGNTTAVELVDFRAHLNNSRRSLTTSEGTPVSAPKYEDSYPATSRCQHIPLKIFQSMPPTPPPPSSGAAQCHQAEKSPYQRNPACASARSLPDSQLYSAAGGHNGGHNGSLSVHKPTLSTSYLPVPQSGKMELTATTNTGARGCQPPSSAPGCSSNVAGSSSSSSSSSSNCSSNNRPALPVYKTPPMPKSCTDDYESIYYASSKMSVKPGPSTMTNYVSVSSLKVRGDSSAQSVSKVPTPSSSTASGSPSQDLSAMSLECLACCERPVDSVFYSCGHMCMCYQCALDYWGTKEKGHCPICRAPINDVIRTYT